MPHDSDDRQHSVWNTIVVPTAVGLEKFFWNAAWFALLVAILFFTVLFPRPSAEGGRERERDERNRAQQAEHVADRSPR